MPPARSRRRTILLTTAAAASAAVAVVFLVVGDGVPDAGAGVRGAVVAWGHIATWILLSAAFGVAASGRLGPVVPRVLGFAALACYLAFVASVIGLI